ncbi:MAG: DinB family protein [Rudaea sp.]
MKSIAEPITTREVVARELEDTRAAFHLLLDSIPDTDLAYRSPGSPWSNRAVLWHIVQSTQFVAAAIRLARTGRVGWTPDFITPIRLRDWANGHLVVPLLSASATRESLARGYDRAHDAIRAELRTMRDEEWNRTARLAVDVPATIEILFRRPAEHFREHASAIRPAQEERY